MSAPAYAAWLNLEGRDCLVVGGGPVATRRARGLLECGALVRVVAPEATDELRELAGAGALRLHARPYEPADAAGAFLVFAATSSRRVNATVAADARAVGALVNLADDPTSADFHTAAVARQGPIAVALGTGGLSPAATAALRGWLAGLLTPTHAQAVTLLGQARGQPDLSNAVERAAALLRAGDAQGAVDELAHALDQVS